MLMKQITIAWGTIKFLQQNEANLRDAIIENALKQL